MNGYHRGRGLEQMGHAGFSGLRNAYLAMKDVEEATSKPKNP